MTDYQQYPSVDTGLESPQAESLTAGSPDVESTDGDSFHPESSDDQQPIPETQSADLRTAAASLDLPSTGDPRVDDAMARLADLDGSPVAEHLDIYQDVHRRLHEALADLDSR